LRLGHEAYAKVLADHHRVVRAALAAHGGREVGTQGDSFFAVFPSPSAAVMAVVEMQKGVASLVLPNGEQIRVRMGLHAGEAAEAPTGLVGLEVHRAARVAGIAHGGQVLVSEAASALVRHSLPPDVSLRDLGWHRLKDLGPPDQIFQLEAPGLTTVFPPLRSLDNPRLQHNLPAQLSSFIGRDVQLARVGELLKSSRLVTLTGPGGTGKTRLALQAAVDEVEIRPDGVWFVDLAPLRSSPDVLREVTSVLGFQDGRERSSLEGLINQLRMRAPLLVLDNCEHLIEACAQLIDRLLRACPGVAVLATSREPLGVAGELIVRVPPLGLPPKVAGSDPLEEARVSEAATLFVARAKGYDDSFVLDTSTAPVVLSICRSLDGLPLALELAAARLQSMTLSDLEKRLGDHLRLLTSGSSSSVSRQKTMRALIDWSYQLLTEPERSVFRRLSVFAGPFDLEAAVAVGHGGEVDENGVEDALFSLAAKSLVLSGTGGGFTRYRLLESIRQFAEDQLDASTDERAGACARLVGHYTAIAARAETEMFGPNEEMWLERLAEEQPNVLAALGHADAGTGTDDWGLALASSLYDYWLMEEPALGGEALEQALSHDTSALSPAVRAKAMWVLAEQCQHVGQAERAIELCTEAFPTAMAGGDLVAAAQCRKIAANAHAARGELARAAALMAEANSLAQRSGDKMSIAQVVHDTSVNGMSPGGLEGARAGFEEALARFEEAGAGRHALLARLNLGNMAEESGDFGEARALFNSVLGHLQDRRRGLIGPLAGLVSLNLAGLSLTQGDVEGALEHLPTVVANARYHPAATLFVVALCASAAGNYETASRLHGAADAILQRSGLTASLSELGKRQLQSDRDALRANAAVDFDHLYSYGLRAREEQALGLAADFASGLKHVRADL
jgi:predicted ATPase